jgi:rubrerythrin
MQAVVDRDYCLRHPGQIAKFFGWDVVLGMLFSNQKTLLERVADKCVAHGVAMPGALGNAYKLSALFEFRVAKIYGAMAERFKDQPEASALFRDLSEEEMEHGRIMLSCLYEIATKPEIDFIPSVRDEDIRESLNELREVQRRVPEMSLDEALTLTDELERGEVNVIFGKLLKQVGKPETELFAKRLEGAQNHSESVPRRIRELKESMAA